ncbi:MAG: helix-turn-helix transcriptional regulator [Eubacteriales bacterium]|nr:helix-turn-helix transcriptional regulator [Eubacteriales bacterium]
MDDLNIKHMLNVNIQQARKNKKLSQAELAEILNVSRQTVSNWERGISVPDARVLEEMSQVFEVSTSTLLGKEFIADDEENNEPSDTEIVKELARLNAFYARELERELERRKEQEQKLKKWLLIAIIAISLIYVFERVHFRPTEIRISPNVEETCSDIRSESISEDSK